MSACDRSNSAALLGRLLLGICVAAAAVSAASAERQPGASLESRLQTLRVGMWAKVEGQRTPDGVLQASAVRVYDGERDEVAVETEILSVDLQRMTLETTLGVRIVATTSTEIEGPGEKRHLVLAALAVGDRVEAEGQLEKDGSLRAEKIDIEKPKRSQHGALPDNKHELTARLESIDSAAQRIVLLGLPVQLGSNTRLRLPD